jgi:tetratricopeptide (TPR) repeat protein
MSPEQASGTAEVDARSDLYALGCMLYEMLAGEPPLTGPTPQATAALRLTETATSLPLLRETVPGGLSDVVVQALAKSPVDRYATAEDLAEALAAPEVWEEAKPKKRVGRRMLAGVISVVLLGAGVFLTQLFLGGGETGRLRAGEDLGERSIAVFPFANNTGADTLDWFQTGLPNLLTTSLGSSESIRVVSVEKVLSIHQSLAGEYTGQVPEHMALEIASASGARTMVDGSIVRLGDGFRLDARLIDVADGTVITVEQVRGSNVSTLADQVSQRLLSSRPGDANVQTELASVSQLATSNLEAFREYHEGLEALKNQLDGVAMGHFQSAIELDSTFALGWLRLAYLEHNDSIKASYLEKAERLSANAHPKDRLLIQAYVEAASGRPAAYRNLLEELITRFPDEGEARFMLARLHYDQGRKEEAWSALEDLLRVDPYDAMAVLMLTYWAAAAGDEAAVDSLSLRFIELKPDQANPYDTRGEVLEAFGRYEEARAMYREAIRHDQRHTPPYEHLATSYLRTGDAEGARAALEAEIVGSENAFTVRRVIADTYAAEGRYLAALDAYLDLDGQAPSAVGDALNFRDIGLFATETGRYEIAEEAYRTLYRSGEFRRLTVIGLLSMLGRQQRFDEMSEVRDMIAAELELVSGLALKDTQALLRFADGLIAWYRLGDAEETVRLFAEGRDRGDITSARLQGHPQGEEVLALIEAGRAADALPIIEALEQLGVGAIRPIITHKAWYLRGRAYEALGEPERALESYERLIATVGEGYLEVLAFQDTPDRIASLRGEG